MKTALFCRLRFFCWFFLPYFCREPRGAVSVSVYLRYITQEPFLVLISIPISAPCQPVPQVFASSLKRLERQNPAGAPPRFWGCFHLPEQLGSPRRSSRWRRGRSAVMNFQRSRAGNIKRCSLNLNTADSRTARSPAHMRSNTRITFPTIQ